jgi:hypothetical protein
MHVKKMLDKVKSSADIRLSKRVTPCWAVSSPSRRFAQARHALLGKSLTDAEAEKHATVIMKGLLGNSWDKPTSKSLHDARIAMDRKMSFSKAPRDLQDMHNQTCNLIVSKI